MLDSWDLEEKLRGSWPPPPIPLHPHPELQGSVISDHLIPSLEGRSREDDKESPWSWRWVPESQHFPRVHPASWCSSHVWEPQFCLNCVFLAGAVGTIKSFSVYLLILSFKGQPSHPCLYLFVHFIHMNSSLCYNPLLHSLFVLLPYL